MKRRSPGEDSVFPVEGLVVVQDVACDILAPPDPQTPIRPFHMRQTVGNAGDIVMLLH